jgi:hypothetical protein
MNRSLWLALCLFLIFALPVSAQEDNAEIVVEKQADSIVVPEEIPQGVVTINFVNNSDAPFAPLLGRLNVGATLEAFGEAFGQGPMAALELVTLLGGMQVMPDSSMSITYELMPGTHIIFDAAAEMPEPETFTVVDAESEGAAPEADVHVSLLDFAFSMPPSITAGEHVWQVENKGEQWHEMGIGRIPDDMTIPEFHAMMMASMAGEEGAEDAIEEVTTVLPMNQGEHAWVTIDLEPGTYAVICFLPDFGSGHAHIELGMLQFLYVTE